MDGVFDDQPQETGHESFLEPIGTTSSANKTYTRSQNVFNTGFTCNSCPSNESKDLGGDEVEPTMCSLVALACTLALFTFDKDESTRDETVSPDQYLAGKNLQQALGTVTEAMKGQCGQSISELLNTPLFSNSLELSNQTSLTKGSQLERLLSSSFRSPPGEAADIHPAERRPVAVLIGKSGAPSPHSSPVVTIGIQLRGHHLGPFVLVTYEASEDSPKGHLCIYFFDSPADLFSRLTDAAGGGDSLYVLTPRDSSGMASTGVESPTQSLHDTEHAPEKHTDSVDEREAPTLENDSGLVVSARPASFEDVPVAQSQAGHDLEEASQVGQDSEEASHAVLNTFLGRASPPPPYELEDPVSSGEPSVRTAPRPPSPRPSSLCEGSPKPPAPQETLSGSQPSPDGSTREPTSHRKSTHSDFEWMHALQSTGPIFHPLPQPPTPPEVEITPKSAARKVDMSPPGTPAPESKLPPPPSPEILPRSSKPSNDSGATAPSSRAPRRRPSKLGSSTTSGPQFFDTNQLDLLFSVPRMTSRGNLRESKADNHPSPKPEATRRSSSTLPQDALKLDLPVLDESAPPSKEMDELSVKLALSPKAAMKQKEDTGSRQLREFEWQMALMGASRSSSSPNSGSRSLVARGKARESSKSAQPSGPWSPLMLRPELTETEHNFDESDISGSPSTYREYTPSKVKSFKASRNDIAWQLALVSTVLKPSDAYMKEQEKRFIELNPRYKPEHFDCLICFETIAGPDGSRMMNCEHSFCRDCMTGHVRSQLEENMYPIICPVCFPDPERTTRGFVDDFVLDELELTLKEVDKFQDLQLAAVVVKIDCPGCKQALVVAREDYLNEPFITCNLPGCSSRFCRACLTVMEGHSDEHTCKVDEELDALMKANGWRYCPGCRTPILKESGCNHMTCRTPGCSTHFCYVCGDSIWDATSAESLGTLLTAHYRNCNQFDAHPPAAPRGARRRRGECIIQ